MHKRFSHSSENDSHSRLRTPVCRPSGTCRGAASRFVRLRHGLNDVRPRGRRGIEESGRSGIVEGSLKQGARDREAEAELYGGSAAILTTAPSEGIHIEDGGGFRVGRAGRLGGTPQLKVTGTREILALVADPKNPGAYSEVPKKLGQSVTLRGMMMPGKDLRAPTPLQVSQVK